MSNKVDCVTFRPIGAVHSEQPLCRGVVSVKVDFVAPQGNADRLPNLKGEKGGGTHQILTYKMC